MAEGKSIAVIGAGLGGLSAAWYLGARHQVTLFDRTVAPGMGAEGYQISARHGLVEVDVPLRVFTEGYYPTLTALYAEAGVATERVDYASSFSDLSVPGGDDGSRVAGETYFRYHNLLLGSRSYPYVRPGQLLRASTRRILLDLARFYRAAPRKLADGSLRGQSLGEYLAAEGFSDDFSRRFISPAYAGICTCSYEALHAFPAEVIVEYLTSGVMSRGVSRASGGTADVVRRLLTRVAVFRGGRGIARVRADARGVEVLEQGGQPERFDHVVIATQAHQAARMVEGLSAAEQALLGRVRYEPSRVVLHRDGRLAPAARRDRASVNFVMAEGQDRPMATIWLNAVQPGLRGEPDVYQTWNPILEPRASQVLHDARFDRPTVDGASLEAMEQLQQLQTGPARAGRRVWLSGSYAARGIPLLESAARSALQVAGAIEAALRHSGPRTHEQVV